MSLRDALLTPIGSLRMVLLINISLNSQLLMIIRGLSFTLRETNGKLQKISSLIWSLETTSPVGNQSFRYSTINSIKSDLLVTATPHLKRFVYLRLAEMFERHISTIQMVLPFLTPRSKNMKSSMAPAMTIMIRFHFIVLKTLTQNQDFVEKSIEMYLTITQVLTLFLLDLGMKGTIPLKSKTKFLLMELILKHFSII